MIHTPTCTGRAADVPVFTDPDPLNSSLNNLRQVKGSPEAFPVRDINEVFTARLQQEFDLQRGMVQLPDETERIYILHRFIGAGGKLSQCDPCLMAHAINLQLHLCESPEERHNMLSKLSWADLVRITQRRAFTDTGNNSSADAFMAEANSTCLHLVKQVIRRSSFTSLSQLCAAYPIYSGIIPQWLPSVLLMGAGNLMAFYHAGDSAWNRATATARAILPWLAISRLSEIEGVQDIVRQFIDAAPEAVATAINQLRAATDETEPLLMLIFSALYLISQQNSYVPLPQSTIGRALQYLPDIYSAMDMLAAKAGQSLPQLSTSWAEADSTGHIQGEWCLHHRANETTNCQAFVSNGKSVTELPVVTQTERHTDMTARMVDVIGFTSHASRRQQATRPERGDHPQAAGIISDMAKAIYQRVIKDGAAAEGLYAELTPGSVVRLYQWESASGEVTLSHFVADEVEKAQIKNLLGGHGVTGEKMFTPPLKDYQQGQVASSYANNRRLDNRLALGTTLAVGLAGGTGAALLFLGGYGIYLYISGNEICIPLSRCNENEEWQIPSAEVLTRSLEAEKAFIRTHEVYEASASSAQRNLLADSMQKRADELLAFNALTAKENRNAVALELTSVNASTPILEKKRDELLNLMDRKMSLLVANDLILLPHENNQELERKHPQVFAPDKRDYLIHSLQNDSEQLKVFNRRVRSLPDRYGRQRVVTTEAVLIQRLQVSNADWPDNAWWYALSVNAGQYGYQLLISVPEVSRQNGVWQYYIAHKISEISETIDGVLEGNGRLRLYVSIETTNEDERQSRMRYIFRAAKIHLVDSVESVVKISLSLPRALTNNITSYRSGESTLVPEYGVRLWHLYNLLKIKYKIPAVYKVYCDADGELYSAWGRFHKSEKISPWMDDWLKTATKSELITATEFWTKVGVMIESTSTMPTPVEAANSFLKVLAEYADEIRMKIIRSPKGFLNEYLRVKDRNITQDMMDREVIIQTELTYDIPDQKFIPQVPYVILPGIKVKTLKETKEYKLSLFDFIARREVLNQYQGTKTVTVFPEGSDKSLVLEGEETIVDYHFPEELSTETINSLKDSWSESGYREIALEYDSLSFLNSDFKFGVIKGLSLIIGERLQAIAQGAFSANVILAGGTPKNCVTPLARASDTSLNNASTKHALNSYIQNRAKEILVNGRGIYLLKHDDIYMSRAFLIPTNKANYYAVITLDSSEAYIIKLDPKNHGVSDEAIDKLMSFFPPETLHKGLCSTVPVNFNYVQEIFVQDAFTLVNADGVLLDLMWNGFMQMSQALIKHTFRNDLEIAADAVAADIHDYVIPYLTDFSFTVPLASLALFPELLAMEGTAGTVFRLVEEGVEVSLKSTNYALAAGLSAKPFLNGISDADRPIQAMKDYRSMMMSLVVNFILLSPEFMSGATEETRLASAFTEANRLVPPVIAGTKGKLLNGLSHMLQMKRKHINAVSGKLIRINAVEALQSLPAGTHIMVTGADEGVIIDALIMDDAANVWRATKNMVAGAAAELKLEKVMGGQNALLRDAALGPSLNYRDINIFVTDNDANRAALTKNTALTLLPEEGSITDLAILADEGTACELANLLLLRKTRAPGRCGNDGSPSPEELRNLAYKLEVIRRLRALGANIASRPIINRIMKGVGAFKEEVLLGRTISEYRTDIKAFRGELSKLLNDIGRNTPEGFAALISALAGNRIALDGVVQKGQRGSLAASDIFGGNAAEIKDIHILHDLPEGAICVTAAGDRNFFLSSLGHGQFYGIKAGIDLPPRIPGLQRIDDDTVKWTGVEQQVKGVRVWIHNKFGDFYHKRLKGHNLPPEKLYSCLTQSPTVPLLSSEQERLWGERISRRLGLAQSEKLKNELDRIDEVNRLLELIAPETRLAAFEVHLSGLKKALAQLPVFEGTCFLAIPFRGAERLSAGGTLRTFSFLKATSEPQILASQPILKTSKEIVIFHIKTEKGIAVPFSPFTNKASSEADIIIEPGAFNIEDVLIVSPERAQDSLSDQITIVSVTSMRDWKVVDASERNMQTGEFTDMLMHPAPYRYEKLDNPLSLQDANSLLRDLAFGDYTNAAIRTHWARGKNAVSLAYKPIIQKTLTLMEQAKLFSPGIGGTYIFRGNDYSAEIMQQLVEGKIKHIQNHGILFASDSRTVAEEFIKIDDKLEQVPVIFKIFVPEGGDGISRLAIKDTNLYHKMLKEEFEDSLTDIIDEIKNSAEVIVPPGALYDVISVQSLHPIGSAKFAPQYLVNLYPAGYKNEVYEVTFNGKITF